MSAPPQHEYTALRQLAEPARRIEQDRGPDPYPRPNGPAPRLEELQTHRDEIFEVLRRHGASAMKVFGSVARGEAGPKSDLDVLIELDNHAGLLEQAALERELEELMNCRVHVVTASGLRFARPETRHQIEREAIAL